MGRCWEVSNKFLPCLDGKKGKKEERKEGRREGERERERFRLARMSLIHNLGGRALTESGEQKEVQS